MGGRPGRTETADGAVDQPRVELAQALLADADLPGHAGPEVLDVNVGFLDQRIELRQVRGLFGVKRDAALVAVVGLAMRAVQAVLERPERDRKSKRLNSSP